jgi:hypothetical protein
MAWLDEFARLTPELKTTLRIVVVLLKEEADQNMMTLQLRGGNNEKSRQWHLQMRAFISPALGGQEWRR